MLIFLIGYMGSGKSFLARELAEKLGYNFLDMDELLVKGMGLPIQDCFELYGEEVFRYAEHELLSALVKEEQTVVATGGGTPCFYDNIELMNSAGTTVYLKVDDEILYQRLRDEAHERPILKGVQPSKLKEFISGNIEERQKFYKQAKIQFDPIGSSLMELVSLLKSFTTTDD